MSDSIRVRSCASREVADFLKGLLEANGIHAMVSADDYIGVPLLISGGVDLLVLNEQTRIEIEAAAFRRLLSHLSKRTDAQNIDLMGLAGFCRNCLGDWYRDAADDKGITLDKAEAREIIYGMPYKDWADKHQSKATDEQLQKMQDSLKKNKEM